MKRRLIFIACYSIYWLLFFIIIKIIFLFFHFSQSSEIGLLDSLRVIWHGLKLDISATSYLILLPTIFMIFCSYCSKKTLLYFFNIYTVLFLFLFVLLCVVDLELYKHWGYRLDATPLMYLNTPGEMFASISFGMLLRQILIGILIITVFWLIYKKVILTKLDQTDKSDWKSSVLFILILGFLIIPIRGGIGIAPLNTGSAYFHNNLFANHAANNLVWNLGYSMANMNVSEQEWIFMEDSKAEQEYEQLIKTAETTKKLVSNKPNVLIIILESFTSKIIKALGGMENITPNFNQLAEEGLLFTNMFASGDRSDKGIISILSGYPAQPNSSIIKFPKKTQSLPGLNKSLEALGYNSEFYYGGEIDFANFRSYFVNMAYGNIISMENFDKSEYNSKWGVHDHILFNRVLNNMDNAKEPFFKAILTLSSHEPFDVPIETVIEGKDDESKFLNSAYYTDKSLGEFVRLAKTKWWWDNTLIVLVADHGCRHPGNSKNYEELKFRIPMLWIGGALNEAGRKDNSYCSQNDITETILSQIEGTNTEDYIFSNNIFDNSANHFGFYVFRNGFGFFNSRTRLVYDLVNTYAVIKEGDNFKNDLVSAKAFLQILQKDFVLR